MPEDVQIEMYHSVPGLENARIVRNAYAIEYDCIKSDQLLPTLEFRNISGLFSAGQFNGSSGYEEAAAQGLLAGINASMYCLGRDQIILDRSNSYIGVLVDDLVTKDISEPYRMMTSRSEFRLLLRQDNADLRLTEIGHDIGLIDDERYNALLEKKRLIAEEIERVNLVTLGANEKVNKFLSEHNSTPLNSGSSLCELIKRPELSYDILADLDENRPVLPWDVCEQVNINIKYEGYIKRQIKQVEQHRKMENKKIPEDIDYTKINSLRLEAVQKLEKYKPVSLGQASRIAGVTPADISVLLVFLEKYKIENGDNK